MTRLAAAVAYSCMLAEYMAAADSSFYAGGTAGISTLSADARAALSGPTPAAGAYKPENGPAFDLFGGCHLNRYLSLQANFVGNRNPVAITGILGNASFEQARRSRQDAFIGDVLLYFRNRRSWVRPYLAIGGGPVLIDSYATAVNVSTGSLPLPSSEISSTRLAFRVAVGIDLLTKSGWGFRYSFSETNTSNPFSEILSPTGQRRLANFQNLFGIVKYFHQRP